MQNISDTEINYKKNYIKPFMEICSYCNDDIITQSEPCDALCAGNSGCVQDSPILCLVVQPEIF